MTVCFKENCDSEDLTEEVNDISKITTCNTCGHMHTEGVE